MESRQVSFRWVGRFFLLFIGILLLLFAFSYSGNFFYIFRSVEEQQVGIQFRNNQIYRVVGPGVYSDFGLFVDLQTFSTQAIPFEIEDSEIITSDKQRLGLAVSGDIFRPGLSQSDLIDSQWSRYRGIYLDDLLARQRVEDFALQSMKECVGDRTFDNNIIGTSRDALRLCIAEDLNETVAEIGLRVENLVVPQVILSPEVQAALDAIVQSRLATEKAAQDELRAEAEAEAEQARQEGVIRIEQSRIQEQARQEILLAELNRERLAAQLAVIQQQLENDLAEVSNQQAISLAEKERELLIAQQDLEIAQVQTEVALINAQIQTAVEQALAALYQTNPEYLMLLLAQANANALNNTDKIIFTPEGMTPTLVLPGPGIVPTVDTSPNTSVNSTADDAPTP